MDWESFKRQMRSNPGKAAKFVALFSAVLIALWVVVLIQSTSNESAYVDVHHIEELNRDFHQNEIPILVPEAVSASSPVKQAPLNNKEKIASGSALSTYIAFILALIAGLWMFKSIKKKSVQKKGQDFDSSYLLHIVERLEVTPSHTLAVVRVAGKLRLMSAGPQGLELMETLDNSDIKPLHAEESNPGNTFRQLFAKAIR